jgi:hypothetical protein
MIDVGYILKRYPVADKSRGNGYNTPTSRKSQEHWDYAQSIAPSVFIETGKRLLILVSILSILLYFFNVHTDISVTMGMMIGVGFLISAFWKVEKQIKMTFPE